MDSRTHKYYELHAEEIFERYEQVESGIACYFQSSFPSGAKVADIGAGSGRDLRHLLSLGYDAIGVEPCDQLRNLAVVKHSQLKNKLLSGSLPELNLPYSVDGIVCSAVLMHLPENLIFDSILAFRDSLNFHGRLLISIPENRPLLNNDNRDTHGRLFNPIEADRLILLSERLGLRLIGRWNNDDALKRQNHAWITLLFEKGGVFGRPLDRIESVLNRDRKVATYKLALLRGLCDLSNGDDKLFNWASPGEVGIPLELLVERWLFYYWPVAASERFIPQIQAESTSKPLKFRASLTELIHFYKPLGGLDVFAIDYRAGKLPSAAQTMLSKTWADIRSAIIGGPVKYSEQGTMFRYDSKLKNVFCDASLWQEFCLVGYWIRDALVLRWAELTIRFASNLSVGEVLDCLLIMPVIEREVAIARTCYISKLPMNCVWTEQRINNSQQLAVDHVLPFSLWHNNFLWNLLPAHSTVNGHKSDKIPSVSLLNKRRDEIIFNWLQLSKHAPVIFDFEIGRTLGNAAQQNWEEPLFNHLKRSCEYGIHIRGGDAWHA